MELTYELIRLLFVLWKSYYNTREVHGLEHVPHPGTPCIVVFNHGNGLVDPVRGRCWPRRGQGLRGGV
jgi:1-acyl-sn-glycerol-3-phosphate acyltransferase